MYRLLVHQYHKLQPPMVAAR